MIDISLNCGLPIQLDDINYRLIMDDSIKGVDSEVRKLEELQTVLYEKKAKEPKELYSLYNDIGTIEAKELLYKHGLRYDIGIMPPLKIGAEYIKTIGHYHTMCEGDRVPSAEVYEIIYGTAHFLLQKQDSEDSGIINDIAWVQAGKGERLIMPPDYAHVTINPGPQTLVLSNLAAVKGKQSYSRIVEMGGFAFYDIEYQGRQKFIKNLNYKNIPEIRKITLNKLESFGINPDQPIYLSAINNPKKFRFVVKPEDYLKLYNKITHENINEDNGGY